MNKVLRAHLALTLSGFLVSPLYARTYTVKAGDTLSGIVFREVGGPVWGPGGTLEKVHVLNPQVKNPNLIYPNDQIVLSDDGLASGGDEGQTPEPLAQESEPEHEPVLADENARAGEGSRGESRHRLRLLGIMSNTKIEAESKGVYKTHLDSDVNTGGEIGYAYRMGEGTYVGFSANVLQSSFPDTKDGRFKGLVKNLKSLSLDLDHRLSESFRIGGFAGVQQFYFVTENSATTLTLEPVFVDNLGLVFSYDAIRREAFDVGLDLRGTYASPAKGTSFKVKSGQTLGGSLFALFRVNETFGVLGNLFYDRRVQDTSGSSQVNTDTGVKLGIQAEL